MLINTPVSGELFLTATGTAFVDLLVNGHRQTWPIRSKRLRTWLRRRHYQETGQALGAGAIRSALDLLEAQAQFDGPERTIHVRVAEHAGHIYGHLEKFFSPSPHESDSVTARDNGRMERASHG